MPILYDIVHTTVYRYAEPVRFGLHRVMFRPRDSHDLRVLATDLRISPSATVRMIQDPHSNSVALVQPKEAATELRLVASFAIELVPTDVLQHALALSAEHYPFAYSVDERFDLDPYLRPHHDDPEGTITEWARQFLRTDGLTGTRELLRTMNQHIKTSLRYEAREEEGTQTPIETLALGSGSCRDYALLMIEAVRRLGIAARFVTGYVYDPALDATGRPADGPAIIGAGATHAWLQTYLPGAGWVAFDPTNGAQSGPQLIRVGVARHPEQAAPVAGSWYGDPEAYLGMEVDVQVSHRPRRGG